MFNDCLKVDGVSGSALCTWCPNEPWVTARRFGVTNASHLPRVHSSDARIDPKLCVPYASDARENPPPGESTRAPDDSSVKRCRSPAFQSTRPKPIHCDADRLADPSR